MFDSESIERIAAASALLSGSREALETARAARAALAERKGRGGAASKGCGRGQSGRSGLARKGAGRGGRNAPSIAERKAKSICKACGQRGHWAGDAERAGTSTLIAERDPDPQGHALQSGAALAEVYAISVDVPLPISACVAKSQPEHKDSGMGVIDMACGMSFCGSNWFDDYLRRLERCRCRLRDAVEREPISETFRFGDGRAFISSERFTIPVALGNIILQIK